MPGMGTLFLNRSANRDVSLCKIWCFDLPNGLQMRSAFAHRSHGFFEDRRLFPALLPSKPSRDDRLIRVEKQIVRVGPIAVRQTDDGEVGRLARLQATG